MQTATQTLVQIPPQPLREPIRLKVDALFERCLSSLECDTRTVLPIRVTVQYYDGRPVVGLASENFSMVNAEDSSDLTHLFCVSGFVSLPEAGVYEITMHGATWSGCEIKNHCCLVHVTRIARLSHAVEIGRTHCCMS
ncbi:hypothetical protein SBC1_60780 (plasmid) [Caballeronia sp. SBC1]|nr:hypothetical protein SBC2_60410 [Caballeronia sp. SBC2]QIN66032.1 hypothetical protein SBC1_60780 [Caballeronia sp. SBC1]